MEDPLYIDLNARKLVYGVCSHVRLNPPLSATEVSKNIEMLHVENVDIIFSREGTTNGLINLYSLVSGVLLQILDRGMGPMKLGKISNLYLKLRKSNCDVISKHLFEIFFTRTLPV